MKKTYYTSAPLGTPLKITEYLPELAGAVITKATIVAGLDGTGEQMSFNFAMEGIVLEKGVDQFSLIQHFTAGATPLVVNIDNLHIVCDSNPYIDFGAFASGDASFMVTFEYEFLNRFDNR
jgi:hypothetical protein